MLEATPVLYISRLNIISQFLAFKLFSGNNLNNPALEFYFCIFYFIMQRARNSLRRDSKTLAISQVCSTLVLCSSRKTIRYLLMEFMIVVSPGKLGLPETRNTVSALSLVHGAYTYLIIVIWLTIFIYITHSFIELFYSILTILTQASSISSFWSFTFKQTNKLISFVILV